MDDLRHIAGAPPLNDLDVGARVMTREGFPGKVTDFLDGPGGQSTYIVALDNDMGGGEYSEGEIWPLTQTDASRIDASVEHTAAEDYPELGTILSDRLPPALRTVASKTAGQYEDRVLAQHTQQCLARMEDQTASLQNYVEEHVDPWSFPLGSPEFEAAYTDFEQFHRDSIAILLDSHPDEYCTCEGNPHTATNDEARDWNDASVHEDMEGEGYLDPPYAEDVEALKQALYLPPVPKSEQRAQTTDLTPAQKQGYDDGFGQGQQGITREPADPLDEDYRIGFDIGWAEGVQVHRTPVQTWDIEDLGKDQTADVPATSPAPINPPMSSMVDRLAEMNRRGAPEVIQTVAGLWDEMKEIGAPNRAYSFDWCRFRKNSHCMLPKDLNEEASKIEGYAVWIPHDRGQCVRGKWTQQQECPTGEPGPNSGSGGFLDATVPYEQGGQRGGVPSGPRWASLATVGDEWGLEAKTATQAVCPWCGDTMLSDMTGMRCLMCGTHIPWPSVEGLAVQFDDGLFDQNVAKWSSRRPAFEFTATWRQVQDKAKRIRSENGVRMVSVVDNVVIAHVKGDNGVYETELVRYPGKQNAAAWHCGCKWSSYSWGRSGPWKKFEGRMCSHALAVQYEAQSRGAHGRTLTLDEKQPAWMDQKHVHRPGDYNKDKQRYSSLNWVEGLKAFTSLHPVHTAIEESPIACIAASMLSEGAKYAEVRQMLLSAGIERPVEIIKAARKSTFKGRIRGLIKSLILGDDGIEDPDGDEVKEPVVYPGWHPSLGLNPRDTGKIGSVLASGTDFHAAAKAMMEMARRNEPDTTLALSVLALEYGGDMVGLNFRFKSEESLLRKMLDRAGEHGGDAGLTAINISDSLRYTMMFSTQRYTAGTKGVLESLTSSGYRTRVKNFWEKGDPYNGVNVALMTPKGHPFELQFHTPESLKAKDITHRLYEDWRTNPDPKVRKELAEQMVGIADNTPVPGSILSVPDLKRQPLASVTDDAVALLQEGWEAGEVPESSVSWFAPDAAGQQVAHDGLPPMEGATSKWPTNEPSSTYGMHYDAGAAVDPRVAEARASANWESLPLEQIPIDAIVATEEKVSAEAIEHYRDIPVPAGYHVEVVEIGPNRYALADGHHRLAKFHIMGLHMVDAKVYRPALQHAAGADLLSREYTPHYVNEDLLGKEPWPVGDLLSRNPGRDLPEDLLAPERDDVDFDPFALPRWLVDEQGHPHIGVYITESDLIAAWEASPEAQSGMSAQDALARVYHEQEPDLFPPVRASMAENPEDRCTACSGTGEQRNGHECYICDASGQRSAELEGRARGDTNANPENGLPIGQDDAIGEPGFKVADSLGQFWEIPGLMTGRTAAQEWQINGKPYKDGVWIEVEPDLWYRGADLSKKEIPARYVVKRDGDKWVWQVQVSTFIGAPHEDTGWQKPGAPKGTAKTLEQAQEKALKSLTKDHEFFRKYDERQRANLEKTLGKKDDEGPTVSGVALKAADTGRILMLQRGLEDEKDPARGKWEFPGGHHEDGDLTTLHAGIREWEEEVGVSFPEGGHVVHTWCSDDGVYCGHVVLIPEERKLILTDGRDVDNPDDPDGDVSEQVAWWDPDDAKKNPAIREECKKTPWDMLKKATKEASTMDIPDEFGSLFDEAMADAPKRTVAHQARALNEWGLHPILGSDADLHDEPEPALPTTDGADEDAEKAAFRIGLALQQGHQYVVHEGPIEPYQPPPPSQVLARVVPNPAQPGGSMSSLEKKQAGFPLCAKGCNYTVSADVPMINTATGLAHAQCPSAVTAAPRPGETEEERGKRLLAYVDASLRGEQVEGPNPFAHVVAGQEDNEVRAAAANHLATTAVKTYSHPERLAIINEGEEERAGNLDRLDVRGTHYEALDATAGRAVPEDEDMTFLDGDPNLPDM